MQGKEEYHGTPEYTPAERGISDILFQRHLRHQLGRGGQPAAGALWLCLRHDRNPAFPHEHRQPAGGLSHRHAARRAGHEAQRAAADRRLCGGLRPDGHDRRGGAAGTGVLPRGHRQGQRYEHLHHSGQRQLCKPHPRYEPDAQLLCLRCAAVPVPDRSGCKGEHRAGRVPAGGAGCCAVAGVCLYPAGRRQGQGHQDQRSYRLELSALGPVLAADRPFVLSERC